MKYSVWLLLALFACGREKLDTKKFKQEMGDFRVRQVTDGKISDKAYEIGGIVVDTISNALEDNMVKSLKTKDFMTLAKQCKVSFYPITDTLIKDFKADIRRIDANIMQTKTAPEYALFDAYLYNAENKIAFEDNVQDLKNGYWIYCKAIVLDKPVCASCHGEKGKDLSDENFSYLTNTYKEKPVFNKKKGDLIGMWAITFSQKELIKKIE